MYNLRKMFFMIFGLIFTFMFSNCVIAGTIEEEENFLEAEGITNSFYMPRTAFSSVYEYEDYCENMYKNGYMDEDYNWIPAAEDFINTPTVEAAEALAEAREKVIKERIESGEMLPEENPLLTYDERQAEIKKREEEESKQHSEEVLDTDTAASDSKEEQDKIAAEEVEDLEEVTDSEETDEEPVAKEEIKTEKKSSKAIRKIFTCLGIIAIIIASFYIFKK